MITAFFLLSISIGGLTLFALKNNGTYKSDIKITLDLMSKDFTSLVMNIKSLILLLIKDLIETSTTKKNTYFDTEQKDLSQNQNDLSPKEEIKSESTISNTPDEDESISEFCPEVVQLIEEEEEKVA